jgi:ribosome-associated toxin RatA of RatAB toxin-antitoxin module
MQTTVAIEIDAPAALVFRLAHRVERWEALLPHYLRSRIIVRHADGSLLVEFVARRPVLGIVGFGLPVVWRARTWNDPAAQRLRFVHVGGATRGMDVTWRIETTPAGCRVAIEHDFDARLPGFAAFVDRWFTRPIAGRTLATFKVLAEALADESPSASESDPPRQTNQPA